MHEWVQYNKGEQERLSIGDEEGEKVGNGLKLIYTKLKVFLVLTATGFVGRYVHKIYSTESIKLNVKLSF